MSAQSAELSKQLALFVGETIKTTQDIKDFTIEQAPDFIQQLLTYHLTISLSVWLLSVIGVIMSVRLYKKSTKYCAKVFNTCDELLGIMAVGSCTLLTIISCAIAFSNTQWIQIWLAPKVFLLEYARSLI